MKFDAPNVGSERGRWFSCANGLEVVRAIAFKKLIKYLDRNVKGVGP